MRGARVALDGARGIIDEADLSVERDGPVVVRAHPEAQAHAPVLRRTEALEHAEDRRGEGLVGGTRVPSAVQLLVDAGDVDHQVLRLARRTIVRVLAVAERHGGVPNDGAAGVGEELVGRRRSLAFLGVEPLPAAEVGVHLGDPAGERVQVGVVGEGELYVQGRGQARNSEGEAGTYPR